MKISKVFTLSKPLITSSLLCFIFSIGLNAQLLRGPGNTALPECQIVQPIPTPPVACSPGGPNYSPFGNIFTPKGDLRILIVYAGFVGTPNPNQTLGNWAVGTNTLPDYVDPNSGLAPNMIYQNTTDFTTYANNSSIKCLSKFYYEMSKGTFRFMGDVFKDPATNQPVRVDIDPAGSSSWSQLNNKVIQKMQQIAPSFNWAPYDTRKNYPSYKCDNTTTAPDNKPDYIVIMYRYSRGWPAPQQPLSGMQNWFGSGGGYSVLDGIGVNYNGYTFDNAGFTYCDAGVDGISAARFMLHEISHSLYDAPHVYDDNGGVGNYFYMQTGYSMMTNGGAVAFCANGWERWLLGWSELKSGLAQENTDIQSPANLNGTGIYTLRDFVTTGDMIRIKMPGTTSQYLWIENHQQISVFDNNPWAGQVPSTEGEIIPDLEKGIYMYIENIMDNRSNIFNGMATDMNRVFGFKILNAQGNFDYTHSATATQDPGHMWNNVLYTFQRGAANPIGGLNTYMWYKDDYPANINDPNSKDGIITHTNDFNGGTNESHFLIKETDGMNAKLLYSTFGARNNEATNLFARRSNAFQVGDWINSGSNPPIITYPYYDKGNSKILPAAFTGLSVKILSQTGDDIQVQIKFYDVDIANDVRWTGNIELPDVSANTGTDMNLKTGKTITLDQSAIPNRHTAITPGNFINPTLFAVKGNSFLNLEANSNFIVDNNSTLLLEPYARLDIANGAVLRIKRGGKLDLQGNSTINVADGGKIIIEGDVSGNHGRLVYNSGAVINLNGNNAVIEFAGLLDIRQNAEFTFYGPGFVKFNYTATFPSQNIIAASGAKIKLIGSNPADKVLEITQETMYAHGLSLFTFVNGLAQLGPDSRLSIDGALTFYNTTITSLSGVYNAHRGLSLFGQSGVSITNGIFEYGKYGLYAILTYGGNPLALNYCTFRYNETGLVTVDKGVTMNEVHFIDNILNGWDALGMSFASTGNFIVGENNDKAISFNSASTGSLRLVSPSIKFSNVAGVEYDGTTTLNITCGNISNNFSDGVLIKNGAKINMSPFQSPAGGMVNLSENINSINASCAGLLLMDVGRNNLKPLTGGGGKAVVGTFNGYGCSQGQSTLQRYNKWKNTLTPPVNGVDYSITQCGCFPHNNFITIVGSSPAVQGCMTELVVTKPNSADADINEEFLLEANVSNEDDPFENCEDCRIINTNSFKNEKLNHAVKKAIGNLKEKDKNYLKAMDELSEILNYQASMWNNSEKWFIELSYEYFKTTLGDAYMNGILANPINGNYNQYVDNLIKIQDNKREKAKKDTLYKEEFYTGLDKALTLRLADKRNLCISELKSLALIALDEDKTIVDYWICLAQKEQDMLDGILAKEEFATAIEQCNNIRNGKIGETENASHSLAATVQDRNNAQPILGDNYPNPFNKNTIIESYLPEPAANGRIVIYNSLGSAVKTVILKPGLNKVVISAESLENGVYFYSLYIGETRIQTKRMSIVR